MSTNMEPLTMFELHDHLSAEAARHTNPQSPDFAGVSMIPVYGQSYDYLKGRVLDKGIDGNSFSEVEMRQEFREFERFTDGKIDQLEGAVVDRNELFSVIDEYSARTGRSVSDMPLNERLITSADLMLYVDARAAEMEERLGAAAGRYEHPSLALHRAGSTLIKNLLYEWTPSPEARSEAINASRMPSIEYGTQQFEEVFEFLRDRHANFKTVTKESIQRLGQEVLDAEGVRQRINLHKSGAMPVKAVAEDGDADSRAADAAKDILGDPEAIEAPVPKVFTDILQHSVGRRQLRANYRDGQMQMGDGRNSQEYQVMRDAFGSEFEDSDDWHDRAIEAVTLTKVSVSDGSGGPAQNMIRFRYRFRYSEDTCHNFVGQGKGKPLPDFPEYSGGRNSKGVAVAVDLPVNLANRLETQIREDPSSVRHLVKMLFLKDNPRNRGLKEDDWEGKTPGRNPVKPPYKDLPKDWNIFLIKGDEPPESGPVTTMTRYSADLLGLAA